MSKGQVLFLICYGLFCLGATIFMLVISRVSYLFLRQGVPYTSKIIGRNTIGVDNNADAYVRFQDKHGKWLEKRLMTNQPNWIGVGDEVNILYRGKGKYVVEHRGNELKNTPKVCIWIGVILWLIWLITFLVMHVTA